jgi:hypothetical protein
MFTCQIVASIVAVFSSIATQSWALSHIPDICSPHQKARFTCPNLNVFNTSSILWGGIGPKRIFSQGTVSILLQSTDDDRLTKPVQLLSPRVVLHYRRFLPIPFYFLARRYPRSAWRYVHIPVALVGVDAVPPVDWPQLHGMVHGRIHLPVVHETLPLPVVDAIQLSSFDRARLWRPLRPRRHLFTLQLPKGGINLNWWGNTVWQNTADAQMVPLKTLAPGQTFGPSSWLDQYDAVTPRTIVMSMTSRLYFLFSFWLH